MIPFPNISPEIFSINVWVFEFSLRWYALSYIVGFVCAITIMKYILRKPFLWKPASPPMSTEQADALLTYLIIGVIVGGRLGYVIFYNPSFYYENPLDIVRVWDGGMAFHGGFIGVILAALVFCSSNKIPLWSGADLIALATPPGLFFGRLANFVNAELWGRPTEVPWGVIFPGESAQNCPGVEGICARHPSQIYEAGLEGVLLFVLLLLIAFSGALKRPALVTSVFAAGYGLSRFFIEYYRVPDPQFFSSENPYGYAFKLGEFGLTMGQMLCLPMILFGIILFFLSLNKVKVKE